jgi:hypothetical protein
MSATVTFSGALPQPVANATVAQRRTAAKANLISPSIGHDGRTD